MRFLHSVVEKIFDRSYINYIVHALSRQGHTSCTCTFVFEKIILIRLSGGSYYKGGNSGQSEANF